MVTAHYLIDANVLSEPLRPRPDQEVVARLRMHRAEIATAAPVWHELVFGFRRLPPSRKRRLIERYFQEAVLSAMPIVPYDASAAEWHAAERARLVSLGRTPPFADGQIAAIAAVNDLTLVTVNLTDFLNFSGLRVEDWRS